MCAVQERTNFEIVQDLAHHAGTSASLLLLDNLEDPSCFYQHGALSELVRCLGNSRLLITTSTRAVCNTLSGALCFELTGAHNEKHVMFELAVRLARGDARRADAGEASPDVKVRVPAVKRSSHNRRPCALSPRCYLPHQRCPCDTRDVPRYLMGAERHLVEACLCQLHVQCAAFQAHAHACMRGLCRWLGRRPRRGGRSCPRRTGQAHVHVIPSGEW